MAKSGDTDTVAVALRRGMRPYDSALIKLALSTIILRRRRKAKKTKRRSDKSIMFHSLPPVSPKARPDHVCNVFSMAEQQVKMGNTSRALSLAKYAALQLSQMDTDTRSTWIHQFLMRKPTTKHSLALWNQIIHLSHQPIASDVLAVALVGMNHSDFAPHWFFLAEICVPHVPIEHVAAAWKQLATSLPLLLGGCCGSTTGLDNHAQAVLTEQLHARLQREEQQCNPSQRWTGSRSEMVWS